MKDFFHSLRFKVFLVLALLLLGLMLYGASTGGYSTAPGSVISAVTAPLQSFFRGIGSIFVSESSRNLKEENARLKTENRSLIDQLVDYNDVIAQNEEYKKYLGIKEQNHDYDFEPARVVGRDPNERFYGFTINKGSSSGIKPNDTVITADGLVGFIKSVGPFESNVTTIFDPSANVSVYSSQTRDSGVVVGSLEFAEKGQVRLSYIPKDNRIAVNDIVVTSGIGGRYPEGMVVGKVLELKPEKQGVSVYGIIEPMAKIRSLRDVFVIKNFDGKEVPVSK